MLYIPMNKAVCVLERLGIFQVWLYHLNVTLLEINKISLFHKKNKYVVSSKTVRIKLADPVAVNFSSLDKMYQT